MATAKQAVEIIDATLRLSNGTARWHADRLRAAGMLPSTPGKPEPVDNQHVALLLLSILSGLPPLSSAALVADYAELRSPQNWSGTLAGALAHLIGEPEKFLEIKVSNFAPSAVLTIRIPDGVVDVASFTTNDHQPRPAFERFSVMGASTLTELSQALAAAEPPKRGRRRTVDRCRRVEFAVKY
jgi:hypothetical protein